MAPINRPVIAYMATGAGDWGGASRSLFVLLKALDRQRFEPLVLFPEEGPIFEALDRVGIRYLVWPAHPYRNPVDYALSIARAAQLFRQQHVDLVHVNYGGFWRMAEVEAARLLRIPVLTHRKRVLKAALTQTR